MILYPYLFGLLVACEAIEHFPFLQSYPTLTFYDTILSCLPTSLAISSQLPSLASFLLSHSMSVSPGLSPPLPTLLNIYICVEHFSIWRKSFQRKGKSPATGSCPDIHAISYFCVFARTPTSFWKQPVSSLGHNLLLLFPNSVPVFKLGTFWIFVRWFRCPYSVFSENSWFPLSFQCSKLLLHFFIMLSVPGGQESTSSKMYALV